MMWIDPCKTFSNQLFIENNILNIYDTYSSAVPVSVNRLDLDYLPVNHLSSKLLRLLAKWLIPLWTINSIQSNLHLLFISQYGNSVTVCYAYHSA